MKIAFIGHRNTLVTKDLRENLFNKLREHLETYPETQFLFGSRSNFDKTCLMTVSRLKEDFPLLQRIYVRAEYQNIDDFYEKYLLTMYDQSFFPPQLTKAGKAAYIERNRIMIDLCDILYTYCDPCYHVISAKNICSDGGTKAAVAYALSKHKITVNFFTK